MAAGKKICMKGDVGECESDGSEGKRYKNCTKC
jgi:hypothetical protein